MVIHSNSHWKNDGQATQTVDLSAINSVQSIIEDNDQDTKIQVEESNDEDRIRFDLGGSEQMVLSQNSNGDAQLILESSNNLFIGNNQTGKKNTGNTNTFIGPHAGVENTSGNSNIFLGSDAGRANTTGSNNIFIGKTAAFENTTGSENTYLGRRAGYHSNGSGNVFLGNEAGFGENGSNKLYIDNTSTINPLIYGEFNNDLLKVNGDFKTTGNITINGNFTLGSSGSSFSSIVKKDQTIDLPNIGGNDSYYKNVTVTGATTNATVMVSPSGDLPGGLVIASARVSAANTVRIKWRNTGGSAQKRSFYNLSNRGYKSLTISHIK